MTLIPYLSIQFSSLTYPGRKLFDGRSTEQHNFHNTMALAQRPDEQMKHPKALVSL